MGYSSTEAELPEFLKQLAALPQGAERTALLEGAERLGKWVVPTLLELLGRTDAAEAVHLWSVLTRMIVADHTANERGMRGELRTSDLAVGENALGVRELLLIYRAALGRNEQGPQRCRSKCCEVLLERERERAVAEPIFRELGLEPQLGVRWDDAVERNDHAALWEQVGAWLCASPQLGAAKLADALMHAPEEERWTRVQLNVERCVSDFQRATRANAELFRWAEARTLQEISTRPHYERIPALVGMLGGSTELAPWVMPMLQTVSRGARREACVINHALYTPGLREPILAKVGEYLTFRNPVEACRIAEGIGAHFPEEVAAVVRAALPSARDPGQLQSVLGRLKLQTSDTSAPV